MKMQVKVCWKTDCEGELVQGWARGGNGMFPSACKNHFISLISLAALRIHNESQDCYKIAFPQLSSSGIS